MQRHPESPVQGPHSSSSAFDAGTTAHWQFARPSACGAEGTTFSAGLRISLAGGLAAEQPSSSVLVGFRQIHRKGWVGGRSSLARGFIWGLSHCRVSVRISDSSVSRSPQIHQLRLAQQQSRLASWLCQLGNEEWPVLFCNCKLTNMVLARVSVCESNCDVLSADILGIKT